MLEHSTSTVIESTAATEVAELTRSMISAWGEGKDRDTHALFQAIVEVLYPAEPDDALELVSAVARAAAGYPEWGERIAWLTRSAGVGSISSQLRRISEVMDNMQETPPVRPDPIEVAAIREQLARASEDCDREWQALWTRSPAIHNDPPPSAAAPAPLVDPNPSFTKRFTMACTAEDAASALNPKAEPRTEGSWVPHSILDQFLTKHPTQVDRVILWTYRHMSLLGSIEGLTPAKVVQLLGCKRQSAQRVIREVVEQLRLDALPGKLGCYQAAFPVPPDAAPKVR